jgi:hypothetical protein
MAIVQKALLTVDMKVLVEVLWEQGYNGYKAISTMFYLKSLWKRAYGKSTKKSAPNMNVCSSG